MVTVTIMAATVAAAVVAITAVAVTVAAAAVVTAVVAVVVAATAAVAVTVSAVAARTAAMVVTLTAVAHTISRGLPQTPAFTWTVPAATVAGATKCSPPPPRVILPTNGFLGYSQATSWEYDARPDERKIVQLSASGCCHRSCTS